MHDSMANAIVLADAIIVINEMKMHVLALNSAWKYS